MGQGMRFYLHQTVALFLLLVLIAFQAHSSMQPAKKYSAATESLLRNASYVESYLLEFGVRSAATAERDSTIVCFPIEGTDSVYISKAEGPTLNPQKQAEITSLVLANSSYRQSGEIPDCLLISDMGFRFVSDNGIAYVVVYQDCIFVGVHSESGGSLGGGYVVESAKESWQEVRENLFGTEGSSR